MLTCATSHHPPINLPNCRTPRDINQLHAHLITAGHLRSPAIAGTLILRLSASPNPLLRLLSRRILFSSSSSSPTHPPFLWNQIIKSSADAPSAALAFSLMLASGVSADQFSFSLLLKSCFKNPFLHLGLQLHSIVVKTDFAEELYVGNCLIGFYCRCGGYELARRVFDGMPQRDSVSWNSMIHGYAKNGRMEEARELFGRMEGEGRDLVSWNTMIGGLAGSVGGIGDARRLFDEMPERDLVSWNLMVGGYVKVGRMEEAVALFESMPEKDVISWGSLVGGYMESGQVSLARKLFDDMPERDLVTWNMMLAGYVKNGRFAEALGLFHQMRTQVNLTPDVTTIATVLSAISELGRIRDGVAVHEYVKRNHFPLNGKLGVSLIDMYAKCGYLEEALLVFEASGDTVDHWNAIIGGLAVHGQGELALELFRAMENVLLKPDDITFIGVLNACSHAGLVDEGLQCFEIMKNVWGLEPKVQHYGCIVDILGRAGRLEDAWKMVEEMPMLPNDVIWRSLLSACRKHGDIVMGQKVAEGSVGRGFCDSSSYVLLSNIYASTGLWKNVGLVRMIMRERDMRKKIRGCSWIELGGVVHEFVVGDISHPMAAEIYDLLEFVHPQLVI